MALICNVIIASNGSLRLVCIRATSNRLEMEGVSIQKSVPPPLKHGGASECITNIPIESSLGTKSEDRCTHPPLCVCLGSFGRTHS